MNITLNRLLLLYMAITFSIFSAAQTESGKASYYAKHFAGRKTASGELLSRDSMTCAHRSFPFGTRLRVTNMSNGKEVIVRVNDRGPFRKGRIIDLSWAAAKALGMITQGVASVTVERLRDIYIPFRPDDDDEPCIELDIADIMTSDSIVARWRK